VRSALLRSRSDYQSVTLAGLERMLCPVATRQELLGFIWATLAPGRQPSDVLRTSLEQAARAVALELLRDRAAVEIEARLRRVLSAPAREGRRANLVAGGVCRSLEEERRVIVKARELQDLVSAPAPEALLWLERLEVLTALFEPSASSRLAAFMETTLGPLRELEARQATQLLRTLDAYYQALGNRAQAARGLGIHINTLYKRLDRLNELVGPLDDPVRAVPLQVAVLAWAIRHPM